MTTSADETEQPSGPPDDSAGDVLIGYMGEHVQKLRLQDSRVRHQEPDAVHQMRVASRRLRSALATYRSLVDVDTANKLRFDLRWLARVLGAARDIQVMQDGITDRLADEPRDLIVGPVVQRVTEQLDTDLEAARQKSMTALDSARYRRLVKALEAFLAAPPLTEEASGPAHRIVPRRIRKEWKKLKKLVRAAEDAAPGSHARDVALHEVRKRSKRLRYAAETAIPVRGKPARQLADAAQTLQSTLGIHQDSIVARELLLRLAAAARLRRESGFTYGRLHALEQTRGTASEEMFEHAWARFEKPNLDS